MSTPTKGHFVWHELVTPDPQAALAFYGHVVGWKSREVPGGNGAPYHVFEANGRGMGGVYQLSAERAAGGMKTFWVGYVSSENVDEHAQRLQQLGGKMHGAAQDIGVGRMARVEDPQGAGFILFKPKPPPEGAPPAALGVGSVGWNELVTTDWKGAFAFYSELFGWEKDMAVDMGPMGTYQTFKTGEGAGGGMMNNPDKSARPEWKYYFVVDSIDAGAARVKEKGGTVTSGPHEVPGGAWTLSCVDPQGAVFALTAPKK